MIYFVNYKILDFESTWKMLLEKKEIIEQIMIKDEFVEFLNNNQVKQNGTVC